MTKFEIGRKYCTRLITDADTKVIIKITGRTTKTIVTDEGKRFKIFQYDGSECVKPWGNYSMAPTIRAEMEMAE
jgi:hypothetical protein